MEVILKRTIRDHEDDERIICSYQLDLSEESCRLIVFVKGRTVINQYLDEAILQKLFLVTPL